MRKSSIESVFCFLIIISVITIVSTSNDLPSNGEVEDESEFNYIKNGAKGPERWGKLKPEWKLCSQGKMQSPINLKDSKVKIDHSLGSLRSHYQPSNATIKNRGHDIMLRFNGNSQGLGISINGSVYKLKQLHWHSPSEHTINGKRYVLEEHMVHESKDGRSAVIAFFYNFGTPDSFLLSLEKQLKKLSNEPRESEENVGIIDPERFNFELKKYYRYIGSLTTPPCTQNVIWSISKQMKSVTKKQLKLLRVAVHDVSFTNARPLQRDRDRILKLYVPQNV